MIFQLRDYQNEAVNAVFDQLKQVNSTLSKNLYIQECLDEKTEILTKHGWLLRRNVREDDIVAAFNLENDTIAWLPIKSKIERPLAKGEKMVGISSPNLDIRVTGDHTMIIRSMSKNSENWVKISAINATSLASMFKIPVAGNQIIPDEPIPDDEIRMIGCFLIDGKIMSKNNQLIISQSPSKIGRCNEIRRILKSCHLMFDERIVHGDDEDSHCAPCINFIIPKMIPQSIRDYLFGWAHFERFFDHSSIDQLEKLSTRQFDILVESMNSGGWNKDCKVIDWNKQTILLNCGTNKALADNIQSLCVRHGYSCKLSSYEVDYKKKRHVLYIKGVTTSTAAGANLKNINITDKKSCSQSNFGVVPSKKNEIVWCVENELGTLITRRNGKVAILGNCGRGLRFLNGKFFEIIDRSFENEKNVA